MHTNMHTNRSPREDLGNQVFQDRVVVFSVMDFSAQTEFERIHYLEGLKARLKKKFGQRDILITVQELVSI